LYKQAKPGIDIQAEGMESKESKAGWEGCGTAKGSGSSGVGSLEKKAPIIRIESLGVYESSTSCFYCSIAFYRCEMLFADLNSLLLCSREVLHDDEVLDET
jgi:hypothetical protein